MGKTVKSEHKTDTMQTELAKRAVLRMNNQQSNELTRECIDMAMIYLMSEKPYESITISEIAKRAGVSRTAFYRNYNSKEDVLNEIGRLVIEDLKSILRKLDTADDAHALHVEFFTMVKKNRTPVELLVKGNVSIQLLFPDAQILENVVPSTTMRDHYRLVAIDSALVGLIREWVSNGFDLSPEEMAEVLELGVLI